MKLGKFAAIALVVLLAQHAPAQQSATRSASGAPLEILVLGSGGPAALGRASSSYVVLLEGGARILVDAGPGSFVRLGEAHLSPDSLDTVLLTHLHVDHAAELPGFVKARAVSASGPIHFDVFGPAGRRAQPDSPAFPSTSEFVRLLFGANGAFAYLKDFSAPVSFNVIDLPGSGDGKVSGVRDLVRRGDLKITAIGGHHDDAPATIYRIDFRGRSVVFSGDIDAHGLPALEQIAHDANLLVFDAVVLDPPGSPEVLYSLHTPPNAIGALAQRARVGAMLLSHLSPAVEAGSSQVKGSIATHYSGPVTFATDGMRVRP